MKRVLILVGVSQPGGDLVKLQSIASSFEDLRRWAQEQKFDQIIEFSDLAGQPVYLNDILGCIEKLDSSPHPPDQLVVYFNGHGLHNSGGDLWLLSKAPTYPNEAVNLYSSVFAAYYRNFKHVVLVTDACRVAPTNLKFAAVSGGSIFPNADPDGESKAVDQFFAATLGDPALEVSLQGEPRSIYTVTLSELLRGEDPTLLEMLQAPNALPKVIRSHRLKEALKTAVRARLLKNHINQNTRPDAILSSDPTLWLSTFDQDPPSAGFGGNVGTATGPEPQAAGSAPDQILPPSAPSIAPVSPPPPGAPSPGILPMAALERAEPEDALIGLTRSAALQVQLTTALSPAMPTAYTYEAPRPWIPDGFHYETSCGFLLSGAEAVNAKLNGPGNVYSNKGQWVKFVIDEPRLALVTLDDGSGFLLPAIPGQIGFIDFDGKSIQTIAYEPSANYGQNYERQESRYRKFSQNLRTIRDVRDTFTSAASAGDLRLAVLSPQELDAAISVAAYSDEDVDLILLVLLGYSCAASGKHKELLTLCHACTERLGFLAFDLHLLASASPSRSLVPRNVNVLPPFPIAAQGWAMLGMAPREIQQELGSIQQRTFASPWTFLAPEGVQLCRRYIEETATAAEVAVAAY